MTAAVGLPCRRVSPNHVHGDEQACSPPREAQNLGSGNAGCFDGDTNAPDPDQHWKIISGTRDSGTRLLLVGGMRRRRALGVERE